MKKEVFSSCRRFSFICTSGGPWPRVKCGRSVGLFCWERMLVWVRLEVGSLTEYFVCIGWFGEIVRGDRLPHAKWSESNGCPYVQTCLIVVLNALNMMALMWMCGRTLEVVCLGPEIRLSEKRKSHGRVKALMRPCEGLRTAVLGGSCGRVFLGMRIAVLEASV